MASCSSREVNKQLEQKVQSLSKQIFDYCSGNSFSVEEEKENAKKEMDHHGGKQREKAENDNLNAMQAEVLGDENDNQEKEGGQERSEGKGTGDSDEEDFEHPVVN
eukprot:616565-Hanusia_phi.AAC.3